MSDEYSSSRVYIQTVYLPPNGQPEKALRVNITHVPGGAVSAEQLVEEALDLARRLYFSPDFAASVEGIGQESATSVRVTHLIRHKKTEGSPADVIDFYNPSVMEYKMVRLWIGPGEEERISLVEAMTGRDYEDIPVAQTSAKGNNISLNAQRQHEALVPLVRDFVIERSPVLDKETGQQKQFLGKPVFKFDYVVGLDVPGGVPANGEHDTDYFDELGGSQSTDWFDKYRRTAANEWWRQQLLLDMQRLVGSHITEESLFEAFQALDFDGWKRKPNDRITQVRLIHDFLVAVEQGDAFAVQELTKKAAVL